MHIDKIIKDIKHAKSVRRALPQNTINIWPMDGFLETDLQQKVNAGRAGRVLIGLDAHYRKKTGRPPNFLLLNCSLYMQRFMLTAFPGRVFNPADVGGQSLLPLLAEPDELMESFANSADVIVAFGDIPLSVQDVLDNTKHEGILHKEQPVPVPTQSDDMNLTTHVGESTPYGQYEGYLGQLQPTRYSPTRGVQIREIVDYRPKYHI